MSPQADQDHRRFGATWAKLEIFLGLTAAGLGLFLGGWAVSRAEVEWASAATALPLFVLGGYLALAGQRSHVYRSNMESTARLLDELRGGRSHGAV